MKCKLSVIFPSKFCTYRGEKEMALNDNNMEEKKINYQLLYLYIMEKNI